MNPELSLAEFRRSPNQLFYKYEFDELTFTNSLWYHDCDFDDLEERYGRAFMRTVYLHIGAFEMNKIASLRPSRVTFGPFADLVTPAFVDLWSTVFHNVWAQWRFENDLPDAQPPVIDPCPSPMPPERVRVTTGQARFLTFCGGGKDSLVAFSMLERLGLPAGSFAYASSIYGPALPQHRLIDSLLDTLHESSRHKLTIYDDMLDSPVVELRPDLGVKTLTAAETPSSLFEAIPLALQHGYTNLVLAHERSADVGNLIWDRTGEDVNHQWGKSAEAEYLLATYLQDELVENLQYFSILKAVNDVIIFGALRREPWERIARTHSCNIAKPWCRRCPKCVYVWLNYLAYLDENAVAEMFGEDLFDVLDVEEHVTRMLGLGDHTPFECIGQIEESRLALELCRAKGLGGPLMDLFVGHSWINDLPNTLDVFTTVDHAYGGLPAEHREAIISDLESVAEATRQYVTDTIAGR